MRKNLDPLVKHTDKELRDVLKATGLDAIFDQRKGLESIIDKGGNNLSAGEK